MGRWLRHLRGKPRGLSKEQGLEASWLRLWSRSTRWSWKERNLLVWNGRSAFRLPADDDHGVGDWVGAGGCVDLEGLDSSTASYEIPLLRKQNTHQMVHARISIRVCTPYSSLNSGITSYTNDGQVSGSVQYYCLTA